MGIYHKFTSTDLDFAYQWDSGTVPDNPQFIGSLTNDLFNKEQGNDMLYLIRSLAKTWDWTDEETFMARAKQLEHIIIHELPDHIKCYAEIKKWIEYMYDVN